MAKKVRSKKKSGKRNIGKVRIINEDMRERLGEIRVYATHVTTPCCATCACMFTST